jgi:hypothetical protein
MKALLTGVVLALLIAGCQPVKPTYLVSAAEPTPPAGWVKFERDGFSFYAPGDWREPNALEGFDGSNDPSTIQNLSNPAVGAGLAPAKDSATAGASLTLINPSYRPIPGETGTQILIKKETEGGNASLAGEAGESAAAIPRSNHSDVTLPCGPAVEITSSVKTKTGDSSHQIMYVMVNGKDVYRIHLLTANDVSVIKDIARPIADTFRVTKPGP